MSSVCISSDCINDTTGVPNRATYVNLYKWPESDAAFMKAVRTADVGGGSGGGGQQYPRPRVVDSVSCRQLYLRSYTFSRKETVPERTRKCLGRVRERLVVQARGGRRNGKKGRGRGRRRMWVAVRRVKELSCAAFCAVFQKLLSCTATVDVVDHSG